MSGTDSVPSRRAHYRAFSRLRKQFYELQSQVEGLASLLEYLVVVLDDEDIEDKA